VIVSWFPCLCDPAARRSGAAAAIGSSPNSSVAIDDLEPYVPGSFDEIVRAYDLGELTDAGYATLATTLTT